jgi:hypothetical protein
MKKSNLNFSFILVLVSMFLVISCNKDEINEQLDVSEAETRSKSIDLSTIRNMPSVVSGILKFNSKEHLSEFTEDIDDYDQGELESLESHLNFSSLRAEYVTLENNSGDWRDNQSFVIENPFDILVFNEFHELWVGDYIYKFVDKNLIAKTTSPYVDEIVSMRSNGLDREHVELVDRIQKRTMPGTIKTRSTCTMDITMPFNPTEVNGNQFTQLFGYIKPIIVDENGNEPSICAGTLIIDWGDGDIETFTNAEISDARVHRYDVGVGECKTFTVKVTASVSLCGSCTEDGGMSFVSENDMVFCHPITCTPFEHETGDWNVGDIVYGGVSGNEYMARFIMGYDADDYLWHDARAWGKIKHFRNVEIGAGGEFFIPSPFKVNCKITIHGAVFGETCTGQKYIVNQTSGIKNKKELKLQWKLDDVNFRLRSDDDLFCDFEVFNQNTTNGNVSHFGTGYSTL